MTPEERAEKILVAEADWHTTFDYEPCAFDSRVLEDQLVDAFRKATVEAYEEAERAARDVYAAYFVGNVTDEKTAICRGAELVASKIVALKTSLVAETVSS